jgi:5-methylcytosine-specific restriction protein A
MRRRPRQEFDAKTKAAAMKRCMAGGTKPGVPQCETCGIEIRGTPIFEHDIPDGLGGEPTLENCKVHCGLCADIKTHSEDNPRMAKADRVFKAHHGLKKRKGPPMPGSRASGWKKPMNGPAVRR